MMTSFGALFNGKSTTDRKVHTHELLFFQRRRIGLLLLFCVTSGREKLKSHRLNDAWRHTWEKIVCYARRKQKKTLFFLIYLFSSLFLRLHFLSRNKKK